MTFLLPATIGVAIIATIGYSALMIERRHKANKPTAAPRDNRRAIAR